MRCKRTTVQQAFTTTTTIITTKRDSYNGEGASLTGIGRFNVLGWAGAAL